MGLPGCKRLFYRGGMRDLRSGGLTAPVTGPDKFGKPPNQAE